MVWCIAARGLGSIASWEGQVYVRVRRNAAFPGISVVCATHRVTPRSDPRKSCCHARPMVPSSSSGSAVNILLLGRPLCRSEAPSAEQNRGLAGRTGGLRSGTSAKNLKKLTGHAEKRTACSRLSARSFLQLGFAACASQHGLRRLQEGSERSSRFAAPGGCSTAHARLHRRVRLP